MEENQTTKRKHCRDARTRRVRWPRSRKGGGEVGTKKGSTATSTARCLKPKVRRDATKNRRDAGTRERSSLESPNERRCGASTAVEENGSLKANETPTQCESTAEIT